MQEEPPFEPERVDIRTAGAYILVGDRYPFVIGKRRGGESLAVIRLGGHRERGESAWQCAAREVYEEARLSIRPLAPPATYFLVGHPETVELKPLSWHDRPAPLLVVADPQQQSRLSVMYLARTDDLPTPSSEVRGLLLLRPEEVHTIAQQSITLGQYLRSGGQAILQEPLDEERLLEPFLQLRALSRILRMEEEKGRGSIF